MKIPALKVLKKALLFFLISILISSIFLDIAIAADSDGDGLDDDLEIKYLTDFNDADSDDDGVLDGDEEDWNKNTDGKGGINALDKDSDDDGILDGTEVGITVDDLTNDTNLNEGNFIADDDTTTVTSMILKDTDGDHINDGDEDKNRNGRFEPELGETDPLTPDRDGDDIPDYDDFDIDNDGMWNDFEELYPEALDPYDPSDGMKDVDFDRDGVDNIDEYLGDDKQPGNQDWSDPTNWSDVPDEPPLVKFIIDEINPEANQTIIFNSTIVTVSDKPEDLSKGLTYTWAWGDGNIDVDSGVKNPAEYRITHKYTKKGYYKIILSVKDNFDNIVEDTLDVWVKREEGDPPTVNVVTQDYTPDNPYRHQAKIRRSSWIAYHIKDVRQGEKITINFEVKNATGKQGVRVFIIPEKNLKTYREDDPSHPISRKYEEHWQGTTEIIAKKGEIVIEAESAEDIIVIFDNSFYDEYDEAVTINEPLQFSVTITREESPLFLIIMIIVLIIIVIVAAVGGFMYMRLRESKGMTKVSREAAIETQRSLDREMAQLELEIQDSLKRTAITGGPMTAMPLQQQQSPAGAGAPAGPTPAAPGTVPQTPAPAGAGAPTTTQVPGTQPGQAAMAAKPGTTPGQQPMLPTGGAPGTAPGAAAPTTAAPKPAGTQQQQMLPPAQPGTTPTPTQPAAPQQAPAPQRAPGQVPQQQQKPQAPQ